MNLPVFSHSVKSRCRFIQDNYRRILEKTPRNCYSLLLTYEESRLKTSYGIVIIGISIVYDLDLLKVSIHVRRRPCSISQAKIR